MRRAALFRSLFWLALLVSLALALNPQPPGLGVAVNDKAQHFAAFAILTGLGLLAYAGARLLPLGLALSGFGALIEFLQMIPGLNRSSELLDWVADTAAIVVVLAFMALLRRRPM